MPDNRADARLIRTLQGRLQEQAVAKTKAWWEAYMKQVIPFRGVKMPIIRATLHQWIAEEQIDIRLALDQQKGLALALFREKYAEDKLAGILFLQEVLLPAGAIDCSADLPRFARLFAEGWIHDWNICDWFCVKVLGPLIQREGMDCASAVASWNQVQNLWQARASVVAFVNLVADQEFYPLIEEACHTLIRRDERFAKTGVGWLLRDISKYDQSFVKSFLENSLAHFSIESLRNATKHLDATDQNRYLQLLKSV